MQDESRAGALPAPEAAEVAGLERRGPAVAGTAASVRCQGLTRRFGDLTAVDGLTLEVREGELFALLGPNGAGKSTTVHMLTTVLRPTGGTAHVAGFDVLRQPREVRAQIGVVFQEPALDERLTARENLEVHAHLQGIRRAWVRETVDRALAWAELAARAGQTVRAFSGGMRRRLELARALMHGPRVLVLDEPTLGLDPQARRRLWEQVETLRRDGLTALVTTHYLPEAEACDRVAIVDRGRLLELGTPAELKRRVLGREGATLEEVFLALTGAPLRDEEAGPREQILSFHRKGGELTR